MSENTVAIRCKSEMNRWMDSVMVVPQEQADDIEQSIKERMRGFERNGSCYGDVMREIAQHCIQRAGSFTCSDQLYAQWAEFTAIF